MHVIRMSRYVKLLGLSDGMSKEETELLLNTALMHEIGKMDTR
jgi:HD-GYP domain-containing protein (c-di-GMP phosphodiesterase class II)